MEFVKLTEKHFVKILFNHLEFVKKNIIGKKGEDIAKEYLIEKKLKFIDNNFKYGKKEIDLVFLDKKNKILIFVEVKTRRNKNFGEPEESINFRKQKNVRQAADGFIFINREYEGFDVRFDSVSVMLYEDKTEINHIENSF